MKAFHSNPCKQQSGLNEEKRIKARGCTDGRKQQKHTHRDDASSPTVSTTAPLTSCVIDAKEKRDIAMLDVLNAFMQVDMYDL
eukprot:10362169-Ditylum_brightwellii.AAC.3